MRAIWGVLEKLDLTVFYGGIGSLLGEVGAPAIAPKILLCR